MICNARYLSALGYSESINNHLLQNMSFYFTEDTRIYCASPKIYAACNIWWMILYVQFITKSKYYHSASPLAR